MQPLPTSKTFNWHVCYIHVCVLASFAQMTGILTVESLRNEAMFYFELYCTLGYESIASKHSLNFLPLYDYSQLIGVLTNGVGKVNSKCKIEFWKVTVNLSNLCIRCWNVCLSLPQKSMLIGNPFTRLCMPFLKTFFWRRIFDDLKIIH